MADPRLKLVPIEVDRNESLLALGFDGEGRMFVGGREALFVYEPDPAGLYKKRQELYRFGPDSWVFNIAVRGHNLYVLTVDALYLIPDGVVKRHGLKPRKLLWGIPMLYPHSAFHGMSFGPDGDLYISTGDTIWYRAEYGMPDHWAHWIYHHGPEDAQTPFTGTGAIIRLSPDGRRLHVFATGIRNLCGIAFDSQWDLFGPDNDHELNMDEFVPGRMLYITEHSYFNWPRGWMTEKQPWRSDLLQTMTPHLGRYVPCGACYYNEDFFPAEYRDCLFVARWCNRTIPRCPLQKTNDAFATTELPFVVGRDEGMTRLLNVAVGRGGRVFAIACDMQQNEHSPHYGSELFMITTRDDPRCAPFAPLDETRAALDDLFRELEAPSWDRRLRAHIELTRRGPEAFRAAAKRLAALDPRSPSALHLLWLAAADESAATRAALLSLTKNASAPIRLNALRALARFAAAEAGDVFDRALEDADPQVRHAGLIGELDRGGEFPFERVAELAAGTLNEIVAAAENETDETNRFAAGREWLSAGQHPHWEDGTYVRQTAALLLARRATVRQLAALCEDPDPRRRLVGTIAAGFRLTLPIADQPLDKSIPMTSLLEEGTNKFLYFLHDRPEDRRWCAGAGLFSTVSIWMALTMTPDEETLLSLLEHRLADANKNVVREALVFLRLIRKEARRTRFGGAVGRLVTAYPVAFPARALQSRHLDQSPARFPRHQLAEGGRPRRHRQGPRFVHQTRLQQMSFHCPGRWRQRRAQPGRGRRPFQCALSGRIGHGAQRLRFAALPLDRRHAEGRRRSGRAGDRGNGRRSGVAPALRRAPNCQQERHRLPQAAKPLPHARRPDQHSR